MTFDQVLLQAPKLAHLDFEWDEWKIPDVYQDYSTGYEETLDSLSDAANLALAIALGEWLVAAMRVFDPEHEAEDAIVACWAVFSETHFPIYTESDDDEWAGPQRQMLAMTFTMLNDAIFCLHESNVVGMRTDWLLMYCQMVFRGEAVFSRWLDQAIEVLRQVMPTVTPDYERGAMNPRLVYTPPISRRFMDLDRMYDPALERAAANAYAVTRLRENSFVEVG
jgi:hypothetical protein